MVNPKLKNPEKAFWDLFHIMKELQLFHNYGLGEGERRRKVDGYLTSFNERLDRIFLEQMEESNG